MHIGFKGFKVVCVQLTLRIVAVTSSSLVQIQNFQHHVYTNVAPLYSVILLICTVDPKDKKLAVLS